ncbi:MAG: hypothetical protein KatS3mg053_4018 [Candidatus Roseilinea sp.]|nr:MAG: hypothetical protein KatS3mg053_4018 [Candidatus Roseilinea sp.]
MHSPLLGCFLSPDSIVPRPDDPSHGDSLRSQALNRYSYARNSPLVRIDPSGHFDIPSELHDFLAGANYALWSANALITDEATQRALLSYTEPIGESRDYNPAYQLGQLTGNVLAVAQGGVEVGAGAGLAGSGAAACGTGVLCVAGAPALAGGVALAGHGTLVATKGSVQLAEQVTYLQASARELRKNMEAEGVRFGLFDSAHHIVPRNISYGRAAEARRILSDVGIGIDDAVNGVKLPWFRHQTMGLHTRRAVEAVWKRLNKAKGNKEEILQVLGELRDEIESGTFSP